MRMSRGAAFLHGGRAGASTRRRRRRQSAQQAQVAGVIAGSEV
jgi:hypothetical protein